MCGEGARESVKNRNVVCVVPVDGGRRQCGSCWACANLLVATISAVDEANRVAKKCSFYSSTPWLILNF